MAIFDSLRKIFSPGSPGSPGAGDDVAAKRAGKRPQGGGAFDPGGAGYEFLRGFAPAPVSRYEEAQRQREEAARQEEIDQRRARADDLSIRSTETELSNEEADRRRAAGLRGVIAAQAGGGDFVENIAAIAEQYPDLYTPKELEVARIGGGEALQAFLQDPSKTSGSGVPAGIQEAEYWQGLLKSDDSNLRRAAEFALGVRARPVAGGRTVDIGGVPHAWSDDAGGYVPQSTLGAEVGGVTAIETGKKGGGELGKNIMNDLDQQFGEAKQAEALIAQADRAANLLGDGVISGPLSDQRLALARVVGAITGDRAPSVDNTDEYKALVGGFTAQAIKQFGAGTGLSDADREFAAAMSGGNMEAAASALRRIIKIVREQSERKITNYNTRRREIGGQFDDALSLYREVGAPAGGSDLSESSDDELLSILGGG